jgi:pimeloyl-ACP methyl ester carboxylesterase
VRSGAGTIPSSWPADAKAFRRDNPNTEVHLLDTGHFALETHAIEIADSIRSFLGHITA